MAPVSGVVQRNDTQTNRQAANKDEDKTREEDIPGEERVGKKCETEL